MNAQPIKPGTVVKLITGATEPKLVEWTVVSVGRNYVSITTHGRHCPQKVARTLIEMALRKYA